MNTAVSLSSCITTNDVRQWEIQSPASGSLIGSKGLQASFGLILYTQVTSSVTLAESSHLYKI